MLSKSKREKIRKAGKKKGATPSDDGIPTATVNRRLGSLVLTEAQKDLAEKKKQVSAIEREKAYKVIIDLENVRRDFPKDFDAQTLKGRFEALIKNGNEGAFLYGGKLVSVGNMKGFLNLGRHTRWNGVSVHDIFPRDSRCKACDKLIQWSDNHNRTTLKYERSTDIADDVIENLMFDPLREFGAPCNILLVSADKDFVRPVKILTQFGARVFLARPKNCSWELTAAVQQGRIVEFSDILEMNF